VFHKSFSLGFG